MTKVDRRVLQRIRVPLPSIKGECDEVLDLIYSDDIVNNFDLVVIMNEEKKIAQAIMDAQKMHEESYDKKKEKHTKDITQCLLETCKKHGLSDNMWCLLDLAMHWWNDIQCWADDVMANKNILDQCCRTPLDTDVIELTDKARQFADEFRESRLIPPECVETDLNINLCDTCVLSFADCDVNPEFGNDEVRTDNVIKCDGHLDEDKMVELQTEAIIDEQERTLHG